MARHQYTYIFWILILMRSFPMSHARELWPDQWLLGYGQSIPGWGETEETVKTVDLVARWKIPVSPYAPGSRLFDIRRHEVWIESTFHRLITDSDSTDEHDLGIVDLAFLAAFTFEKLGIGEPYVLVGGGPAYLLADIRGSGMDLTANYQAGIGLRDIPIAGLHMEALLKFHHLSNMNLADPNIPMNSLRLLISVDY